MRKALIVGIDYYENARSLFGCVHDALAVQEILERNGDRSVNFDCRILTGTGPTHPVNRAVLKDRIAGLFEAPVGIALFYFAGHGHVETTGGYLMASDSRRGDGGLPLAEILTLANESPAKNKVVVLDSCKSGMAGNPTGSRELAALSVGLTILTAATANQYASEKNGSGVFTTLLVDALDGGAANLLGEITPGSVYAHIDQSLGAWGQRPVFKTNVEHFVSLRTVPPSIQLEELRRLTEFFPAKGAEYPLDPTFEPEMTGRLPGMPPPDPDNVAAFAVLQRYNRLGLLVPVGAPHMWHAAMESKSCKLTVLGEHYRRLVEDKRL